MLFPIVSATIASIFSLTCCRNSSQELRLGVGKIRNWRFAVEDPAWLRRLPDEEPHRRWVAVWFLSGGDGVSIRQGVFLSQVRTSTVKCCHLVLFWTSVFWRFTASGDHDYQHPPFQRRFKVGDSQRIWLLLRYRYNSHQREQLASIVNDTFPSNVLKGSFCIP